MNILLIYPPNQNQAVYSKNFTRMKGCDTAAYPPLGLMYLQGMIKKYRPSDNIKLIDLSSSHKSFDLSAYIKTFNPSVVGLTAYTLCFYDCLSICKQIKKVNPEIKIVLGGPHVNLFPEETLLHDEIDFLIDGDGEFPFLQLIESIEGDRDLSLVESLWFRDKQGNITKNRAGSQLPSLDSIPFPCRDDIDNSLYFNPFFKKRNLSTISSSRGCPFKCTFCDVTDKIFRSRSISNIVDEIEMLAKQYNIDNFFFVDDLFNITPQRIIEFCDELCKRHLTINWIFRGRIDQVSEEMLGKCRQSGCIHIIFGVEDFSDRGLRLIKKRITLSQTIQTIKSVKKNNIKTTANFIIGFPHHKTRKDIMSLNNLLKIMPVDNIQISILIPFPGSELFQDGIRKNILDNSTWSDYVKEPTKIFELPLWNEHFSVNELTRIYEKIIKGYYFHPLRLFKKLMEINSLFRFMQYFRMGLVTLKIGKISKSER